MIYLKRFFKYSLRTVLVLIGFLTLYIVVIFILSKITVNTTTKDKKQDITIYILSNGIHTDIVVPTTTEHINWNTYVQYKHTSSQNTGFKYLGFGWGDKGFYLNTPTWDDLTFSTAFKAATGLSSSAVHCTYHHQLKETDFCKKISISKEDYILLVAYIKASFQEQNLSPIHIPNNYYGETDAFYEGIGTYSLFYTCNTWANQALKAANQKACLWTLRDQDILNLYTQLD